MDTDKIIYLDNAATTFPKPDEVHDYAYEIYKNFGANAERGQNKLSKKASKVIEETRHLLTEWFNVQDNMVIFSPSATVALNQVIFGSEIRPGSTVYVSPYEHNSVLRPIKKLEENMNINLKVLAVDNKTLEFDISKIKNQFNLEPPEMIVITHASNVCGVVPPVKEIASLAKNVNNKSIFIVDGAQLSCIDGLVINDGLIDYYIFSGHKALYGPYGIAGFVLCSDKRPAPFILGGTGTNSESLFMPNNLPDAYESGSKNLWAIAGLNASINWLNITGKESIFNKHLKLLNYLINGLHNIEGVKLYKPESIKSGVISFNINNIPPQSVENYLSANSVYVRSGLHCSPWAHDLLGTLDNGGTVRISLGYFNSIEDIDVLLQFIKELE